MKIFFFTVNAALSRNNIFIAFQNSPPDTILTAVSYDSVGTNFGNYSTGPISQFGNISGVDRVACLEVKCPFFNSSGISITTLVQINVSSNAGVCNVK